MTDVGIGIIGCGLMGREAASAFARWCALTDVAVQPRLLAVADPIAAARDWFDRVDSVAQKTSDYQELLANPDIDVVYAAVPHDLHERIYIETVMAGKDLLAEKPFGHDLESCQRIVAACRQSNRFVRCSSEMPFFPGAQRVIELAQSGTMGRVLQVVSAFHHSSDLDPNKPGNWKRMSDKCGAAGVMNDLGMHVCHIPLRVGWNPTRLYAQLQKGYPTRPDGRGGTVACDTWDMAQLHGWASANGEEFPLRMEMCRLSPGATNTWLIEILGTERGARFSTANPKTLWTFHRAEEQTWSRTDLGFATPFKVVTGGIFEPGFADVIQQMWAAYLSERDGSLGDRFGCATPVEASRISGNICSSPLIA